MMKAAVMSLVTFALALSSLTRSPRGPSARLAPRHIESLSHLERYVKACGASLSHRRTRESGWLKRREVRLIGKSGDEKREEDTFMRFGLTTDFRNPPGSGKASSQVYSEIIETMVFAESLGFDGAYIFEHHFTDDD